MLHVIWLILKIIGILLLILLCLLLLLLLTVLLVPVRYRVKAEHGENLLAVEGGASWLLHLVNARFTHLEGVFHVRVRVFWFTIFDNLKPKKVREPKKPSKEKKPVDKTAKKIQTKRSDTKNTVTVDKTTVTKKTEIKKQTEITKKAELINKLDNINKTVTTKEVETVKKAEIVDKADVNRPDNSPDIRKDVQTSIIRTEYKKDEDLTIESPADEPNPNNEADEPRIKKSFFEKIIGKIKELKAMIFRFIDKFKSTFVKLKNFIANTKEKLKNLFEKITDIKSKAGMIYNFIQEETNREGFRATYSSVKKLLKHILPTKLKSRIVFGTGDPCSTGQALGAMSILYSFYGDKIQIIADFENKKFEGSHNAQGRIRLITILIIVIKLILDKRFKRLKENFQILKEAL